MDAGGNCIRGELRRSCDVYYAAKLLRKPVTITGANGYTRTGQALLDYSRDDGPSIQRVQLVSNRDQLIYQGDVTVHAASGGAHRLSL